MLSLQFIIISDQLSYLFRQLKSSSFTLIPVQSVSTKSYKCLTFYFGLCSLCKLFIQELSFTKCSAGGLINIESHITPYLCQCAIGISRAVNADYYVLLLCQSVSFACACLSFWLVEVLSCWYLPLPILPLQCIESMCLRLCL